VKLLLRVSSSNEYCDGGCEFAFVRLGRHIQKPHKKCNKGLSLFPTAYAV